jgi:hypothetical protein
MSAVTKQNTFGGNAGGPSLFAVCAGVSQHDAIMHATCAINSVKQRLERSIETAEGVTNDEAWMLAQMLEQTQAILEACE